MPVPARVVVVWDLPTRLFHWLVVGLVAAAYVTAHFNWMDWHVRIGETLLTLIFFRLLWGIFGSATSRFSSFVARPSAAIEHVRHLFHRDTDSQVGHNPAGGWMVLLLLALLLAETLSGLYVNNDVADAGPLTPHVPAAIANAITVLHGATWYVLLAAVVLHLLAIALYALAKGHDLVRPMLTGRKSLPPDVDAPRRASSITALGLLLCAAAAVTLLAHFI